MPQDPNAPLPPALPFNPDGATRAQPATPGSVRAQLEAGAITQQVGPGAVAPLNTRPLDPRSVEREIARQGHQLTDEQMDATTAAWREAGSPPVREWVLHRFTPTLAQMSAPEREAWIGKNGLDAYRERLGRETAIATAQQKGYAYAGIPLGGIPAEHDVDLTAMTHEERVAWTRRHGTQAYMDTLRRNLKGKPAKVGR